MRLILVYLSINPSSSQIFGESLNPIHKDIVFYGHEIEMYTIEQGEKRDKRQ